MSDNAIRAAEIVHAAICYDSWEECVEYGGKCQSAGRDFAEKGWQPPARRIETPEELAAIEPSAIVHAADGTIACRHHSGVGVVFGDDRPFPWSALRPPATVLREANADA